MYLEVLKDHVALECHVFLHRLKAQEVQVGLGNQCPEVHSHQADPSCQVILSSLCPLESPGHHHPKHTQTKEVRPTA